MIVVDTKKNHMKTRFELGRDNPGEARWGQSPPRRQSLLISAPNLDPLLQLGQVSSQSPRGPLGGHACVHTVNWWQYIIKTYLKLSDDGDPSSVILRREFSGKVYSVSVHHIILIHRKCYMQFSFC